MNDEEDVATYFLRVNEVVNSLKRFGEEATKATIVKKFWGFFLCVLMSLSLSIEELRDLENLKMNELHEILNSHRSPYDKIDLGYMGETSYKEYENTKSPVNEVE